MSEATAEAKHVTVWYDVQCPLCVREIALMRRLDRRQRIDFRAVQQERSCPISKEELLARFHAREQDGPLLSGAAAFAAMWRALPLFRPLGLLARNRLVLNALEKLYVFFLKVRPRLQQLAGRALSPPASAD
ncbi:MAG: DUF393 domain-containing protein [Pseudomonadota bacterium]